MTDTFTRMDESTAEQWAVIGQETTKNQGRVADRILMLLESLRDITDGFSCDQLTHCLQTATLAEQAGADTEMIVASLCHDIGKAISVPNHGAIAAEMLRPYVRDDVYRTVLHHQDFQGRHYYQHFGRPTDLRERFRDESWFALCEQFTDDWDQVAFDPNGSTEPLEHFEPLVRQLLREAESDRVMSASALVPLGAAQTVTGSKFLIEHQGRRVLVDAGLFQGLKELRERNWSPFPVDPASLDAVIISHAHLDHCGYLPRLVKGGFAGDVHVTFDTGRLMSVVLPDSARLQEEEAKYANRSGYSRHQPALALYTEDDAWAALEQLRSHPFDESFEAAPGITVTFRPAGHILGSATVRVALTGGPTVQFSGDLGRPTHPILVPPTAIGECDYLVVESTYGDRAHSAGDNREALAAVIHRTVERGGKVIIPAFAVDRTEVLLYHLHQLAAADRLPNVPIFVDSPMALAALQIYREAIEEKAADIRPELRAGELFAVPGLQEVFDAEGSKAVTAHRGSAIIIAGAGMASGGRVVHHLERFLPEPQHTVALVGFQAAGTRGRSLLDGATSLKIHGQYVKVRAEICDLTGFSVHADADELMQWTGTSLHEPRTVFVVHGEASASAALRDRISRELDWNAVVPNHAERVLLRP